MRNTQGRFNICPWPIYPPQVPRQDYSRIIPKSLAELVGMKQTVKGVVVIRVVYGQLPEGRGDQWNKRLIPPLDWPSSVSTTRSTLSTVMTGLTTQELTTFIRSSHMNESHGKRKGTHEKVSSTLIHSNQNWVDLKYWYQKNENKKYKLLRRYCILFLIIQTAISLLYTFHQHKRASHRFYSGTWSFTTQLQWYLTLFRKSSRILLCG